VLVHDHWHNSQEVDMSLHSDEHIMLSLIQPVFALTL